MLGRNKTTSRLEQSSLLEPVFRNESNRTLIIVLQYESRKIQDKCEALQRSKFGAKLGMEKKNYLKAVENGADLPPPKSDSSSTTNSNSTSSDSTT